MVKKYNVHYSNVVSVSEKGHNMFQMCNIHGTIVNKFNLTIGLFQDC